MYIKLQNTLTSKSQSQSPHQDHEHKHTPRYSKQSPQSQRSMPISPSLEISVEATTWHFYVVLRIDVRVGIVRGRLGVLPRSRCWSRLFWVVGCRRLDFRSVRIHHCCLVGDGSRGTSLFGVLWSVVSPLGRKRSHHTP